MGEVRATDQVLGPEAFFDLEGVELPELFDPAEPVWVALARLAEALAARVAGCGTPRVPEGVWAEGDVLLGEGVTLEPGCFVRGPALIGDGATLRHGAYLRGTVVVGAGAIVGHASELKHAVLLPGAAAPHFNYVGDSVLGRKVNLGAGTICSNVRLDRAAVRVRVGDEVHETGLRKFGAILGDGCQTGCNVVLNPGTVAGRQCFFEPLSRATGHYPTRSVVRTSGAKLGGG